jgi:hypothetical protein
MKAHSTLVFFHRFDIINACHVLQLPDIITPALSLYAYEPTVWHSRLQLEYTTTLQYEEKQQRKKWESF